MGKNIKKTVGTLVLLILVAESVAACDGMVSSSPADVKQEKEVEKHKKEENKMNVNEGKKSEVEEVQKTCILAAKAYIDSQMSEEKESITDFSEPSVGLFDEELGNYSECKKNYEPKGNIYKVIFETKDDAVLGPIVCFVDEEGVVFGLGWRD